LELKKTVYMFLNRLTIEDFTRSAMGFLCAAKTKSRSPLLLFAFHSIEADFCAPATAVLFGEGSQFKFYTQPTTLGHGSKRKTSVGSDQQVGVQQNGDLFPTPPFFPTRFSIDSQSR